MFQLTHVHMLNCRQQVNWYYRLHNSVLPSFFLSLNIGLSDVFICSSYFPHPPLVAHAHSWLPPHFHLHTASSEV